MKRQLVLLYFLLTGFTVIAQPKTKSQKALILGESRIIHSTILHEDRTLNIFLPDSFSVAKSYPVFYLLDGSMNEDFPHIAGLLQFFHLSYGMPDCILVGIANIDRRKDYTFASSVEEQKKSFPTTGHSDAFIGFIETELKPYIGSVYKTNGTDYLIGQSLGGLLAVEILLKNPELFRNYFIVSPSLWWDNESLLLSAGNMIRKADTRLEGKQIFISVGGMEDPVMQRDAKQLVDKLDSAAIKNTRVQYFNLPEENHATILHQAIDEDLKKIFPYRE